MGLKSCVVIIPVYKEKLSSFEEASFRQGLRILRNHDIVIVSHLNLDLSFYRQISEKESKEFDVEFFEEHFFESVKGYNSLCLDSQFYKRFEAYKYMFIYQTDAWVFRDELLDWCDKKYDYIGAPHFVCNDNIFSTEFLGVGNGGFSLRRIQYCIDILSKFKYVPLFKPKGLKLLFYNHIHHFSIVNAIGIAMRTIGIKNTVDFYKRENIVNEDFVFGTYSKYIWGNNANIPSCEEAARFSFEIHPEFLYHLCGDKIPFGCHAYRKYDYETFWNFHIKD